jgi:hypothetical protein
MELSWKPAEHVRARMREFSTTSYAGNPKGRFAIDFAECLGLLNVMVVPKQIFVRGVGGSPVGITASCPAPCSTSRMNSAFKVDTSLTAASRTCRSAVRAASCSTRFASGEELSSRPNFGRTTEMNSWTNAATFWELNVELLHIKAASVEQHGLTPFTRRISRVDLVSRFTGNESLANPAERMYKEDPTLREFLQSPVARHIRLHEHLLPLLQEYSVLDMQNFLSDPGDDIVAATLKLAQQMAAGGMKLENTAVEDSDLKDIIKVLSDFHKTVPAKGSIAKKYLVRTNQDVPGHHRLTGRDGKPSKIEN